MDNQKKERDRGRSRDRGSRSRGREGCRSGYERHQERQQQLTVDKSDRIIRDAEASKARVYEVSGRPKLNISQSDKHGMQGISAVIDEGYKLVGAHIDEVTRNKIINNEFVDFAKLLPRGKVPLGDQEQCFQLYNKGGDIIWSDWLIGIRS